MKFRQRRALYAIAATLIVIAAGVGLWTLFIWSGNAKVQSSPSAKADARTADATSTSIAANAAAQPTASASAAGGVPVSVRPRIQLRSSDEAARMQNRLVAALGAMGIPAPAGTPRPRVPLAKEELRQPPGREYAMVVKFRDSLAARAEPDGNLLVSAPAPDPSLQQAIEEYGLKFSPSQTAPDEDLIRLEARALANTQTEPADLGGMLSVRPAKADADGVWAAAQALQKLDAVEFVTLASLDKPPPPPLPYDISPTTPLLSDRQTYRGTNGINIDAAWAARGARGQGVRVTDCEYSFNVAHEDLRNLVAQQPGVSAYYIVPPDFTDDHGSAVLGILGSAENNYGMTGTIPQATLRFYGEYATVNGATQFRAPAITAALTASSPGDVVLLEMQTTGAQGGYGPAEYDQAVWTATKTGTDAGIHVVAAAGNGTENLDAPEYDAYRTRGDSGAIIVGAGNQTRAKMGFSTYGTRVNVQGWGDYIVASLGYGDLATYGGDHNQKYTTNFAGTSSASPIVTTAVAAVESVTRLALGRPLTPSEMRQLLVATGKPQTGDTNKNIGPLPDVVAALDQKLAGFPAITSVVPGSGSAGTSVAITGSGFTGTASVAFGGTATTNFSVASDTTINATVPAAARTGRVTVTKAPSVNGVSPTNYNVVAAAAGPAATADPPSLTGFTAHQGSASAAQTFTVRGDSLDGDIVINVPAGYEISLDGTNFFTARSTSPSAPADSASNYTTNWTTGGNAGLGFGAWAMTFVQGTNYFAGKFLGDPASAGIGSLGTNAFGLYANPANSPAEVRADRALARPLKVGEAFTFRWGVNWDANGPGSKGFALYTGGAGMTEILRIDQGGYSGNIVFAVPGVTADTAIAHGTNAMTWTFTRTASDSLQVTSTGRDGGANNVFSTNVTIPGAPDALRWYATQLDNSGTQADDDKRQPYFNNLGIVPAFGGGGSLGATTVHVRLAADATPGILAGNITIASAGTTLATIAASGNIELDYDLWVQGYKLDPAGSGARDKDPDADGLSNRTEFVFGSDPTKPTAALSEWNRTENGYVLKFLVLTAGASYEVQTRADLAAGQWSPSGLTPTQSTDKSGVPAGYLRMECNIPAAARAFYRISATLP